MSFSSMGDRKGINDIKVEKIIIEIITLKEKES